MALVRVCPCACLPQKYDSMGRKSSRQKQCKRIMEQQPRIINARRRKAASSSEVCDECDLTDDRGARSLTACASVPVANASRTCFPTGQEPPVEVLQTLLAASDRAADARHPRDAKHGHESRTEHLEVATRFSSGLIFRLIRLHTVTKKCVHTVRVERLPHAGSRSVVCLLLSVSVSVGEPLDNCMQARKRARSALEGRLAPPQLVYLSPGLCLCGW